MKACTVVGRVRERPACDPMVDMSYKRNGVGELGLNEESMGGAETRRLI